MPWYRYKMMSASSSSSGMGSTSGEPSIRKVSEATDVVGAEGGGHVDDPYAGPPGGGEQSSHGGDDVRLGHCLGRLPTGVGHVADDSPLHLVTEHHRRGRFD
jgi:hypothetical protein